MAVGVSPGKLALDVRSSTSINEASADVMSVFPNPTEGAVTVRSNALRMGEPINILDASGRCVLNVRANALGTAQIDVTGLANGIYTVRTTSGITGRFTKR